MDINILESQVETKIKDFGVKNIALIALVAILLVSFAWVQKPMRLASKQQGLALYNQPLAGNLGQISSGGQVLGATEYNPDIAKEFSNIKVNVSSDTSSIALGEYANQVRTIIENENATGLVSAKQTQALVEKQTKLLTDLGNLVVPSVFEDYHRLLLAEYNLIFAQKQGAMVEGVSESDIEGVLSVVQNQLSSIRQGFYNSVQLFLP
ncbi:MAG: hypothetical protein ACYC5G_04130 [Candidatus Doudnabacteria bacterium]